MNSRVRVFQRPDTGGYHISFIRYDGRNAEILKLGTNEWHELKANQVMSAADGYYLHLPEFGDWPQHLADALYEAGIKPRAYVPTRGELDCKDAHIADLRRVVEALLAPRLVPDVSKHDLPKSGLDQD